MKKLSLILCSALTAVTLLFTACGNPATTTDDNTKTDTDTKTDSGSTSDSSGNSDTTATEPYYEIDAGTAKTANNWYIAAISLQDYASKTVDISFSAKMKVVNAGSSAANIMWSVNDSGSTYPTVASHFFAAGTTDWTEVTGSKTSIELGEYPLLYISTYGLTAEDLTIDVKDIEVKVNESGSTETKTLSELKTGDGITNKTESTSTDDSTKTDTDTSAVTDSSNWLSDDVPSLYETYKKYFDYFGFAVEYGNSTHTELYYKEIQNGLKKHANTISLGNEFKPDFMFNWGWWRESADNLTDFTASNGKTIKVPSKIPTFELQDEILKLCQTLGIHMRGHVLLWHSQTPDRFFYEDYGLPNDSSGNATNTTLVDAATMDARLEWYIKTVVQHCDNYTVASDGKPVIWAWDVANECTSDGSQSDAATSTDDTHWLRTSGSMWYKVYSAAKADGDTNYYTGKTYESYDFVVNAFRFANKYANAGTKLVYNDYGGLSGTTTSSKHQSQLRLVQAVLDHNSDASFPTRIDAMGLQSHYSVKNSAAAYQTEIQDFIAKGLDVQITELDIATCESYNAATDKVGCSGKQFNSLADAYAGFMKMFIDNRKTDSKNGVSCVTIWGLSDQQTWLNTAGQNYWIGKCQQYPLIFNLVDNIDTTKNTYYYYTDYSTGATAELCTLPSFDDGDSYSVKPAFWSVINAAKNYAE